MKKLLIIGFIISSFICNAQYTGYDDDRRERIGVTIIIVDSMYANSIDTITYFQRIGGSLRSGNKAVQVEFEGLDCVDSYYDIGVSESGRSISTYDEIDEETLPINITNSLCKYAVSDSCIPNITYNSGIWDSEFLVHIYIRGTCQTGTVRITE